MIENDKEMEISIGKKFTPKNLLQLVELGINTEWFACNIIYEVLE